LSGKRTRLVQNDYGSKVSSPSLSSPQLGNVGSNVSIVDDGFDLLSSSIVQDVDHQAVDEGRGQDSDESDTSSASSLILPTQDVIKNGNFTRFCLL